MLGRGTVGLLAVLRPIVSLLALARHNAAQLNFFVLQDVHEDYSCHVRIIGRFVVMTQHILALVVRALILRVKSAPKVRAEFTVLRTLLVDLPKTRVVECLRVVG